MAGLSVSDLLKKAKFGHRLAYEFAPRTQLKIIAVGKDSEDVQKALQFWIELTPTEAASPFLKAQLAIWSHILPT